MFDIYDARVDSAIKNCSIRAHSFSNCSKGAQVSRKQLSFGNQRLLVHAQLLAMR